MHAQYKINTIPHAVKTSGGMVQPESLTSLTQDVQKMNYSLAVL